MNLIRNIYRYLKNSGLKILYPQNRDFQSAREKLLLSNDLKDEEKALLNKVSLRTHRNDDMYKPTTAQHYLTVGLSAIRCIENALDKSSRVEAIRSILDFACGYGRVLRFLRVRFPDADITISEINPVALDFCKQEFSVKYVISDKNFSKLSLPGKFDLIWCGSLITHIDEKAATDLLRFFHDVLSPGGLCVFTTHGQTTVKRIQEKSKTYDLSKNSQHELLSLFHKNGYGYGDYRNQHGYGISVVSHERVLAIAQSVGQWDESIYLERGWDNHQDVYGFTKA